MITEQQRILLKRLMFSPEWKAVEHLIEIICDEIKRRPRVSASEWETLKKTIAYEAEEQGLHGILGRIVDEASLAK